MSVDTQGAGARVVATRGGMDETLHGVAVAVARPDGQLIAHAGDPHIRILLRSTAKPFQAQALFVTGAIARFGLDSADIALACASHDAALPHLQAMRRLLRKIALSDSALDCGAHAPLDASQRDRLVRGGETPNSVHNNCSGKHAGMLASAIAMGAPTQGYLQATHPLQVLIREIHEELAGATCDAYGIDGCSAPTWQMSLEKLALMYARLADPDAAPARLRPGLQACFQAMRQHPLLVAGEGVIDTRLMRAIDGVVCKRGAAGCYGMAVRHPNTGPIGVALKVLDGSSDARTPAILRALDELGITSGAGDGLDDLRRLPRTNCNHRVVGHVEARFHLCRP